MQATDVTQNLQLHQRWETETLKRQPVWPYINRKAEPESSQLQEAVKDGWECCSRVERWPGLCRAEPSSQQLVRGGAAVKITVQCMGKNFKHCNFLNKFNNYDYYPHFLSNMLQTVQLFFTYKDLKPGGKEAGESRPCHIDSPKNVVGWYSTFGICKRLNVTRHRMQQMGKEMAVLWSEGQKGNLNSNCYHDKKKSQNQKLAYRKDKGLYFGHEYVMNASLVSPLTLDLSCSDCS